MCKKASRIWSVMLVIVMLIHMLPMNALAVEYQKNAANTAAANSQAETEDAQIVREVTEKRTEYTKQFALSNGLYMAAVYDEPVHYLEDGQWKDIDNTLRLSGAGTTAAYSNTAGIWDVSFPQQLSGSRGVRITKDGHTLTFYMSGELRASTDPGLSTAAIGADASVTLAEAESATAQVEQIDLTAELADAQYPETVSENLQSRLHYADVFPNTDIIYDLTSNQLKESIVMERYSETLRGYRYTLEVGDLIPVLNQDGQIGLYTKTGKEPVMVMPAPFLLDSAGASCNEVTVGLEKSGNNYILTYTLPQTWLAAEERQWPVILDPAVQPTLDTNNIRDRTVCASGGYAYDSGSLLCGYYSSNQVCRIYVKYLNLPALTSADMIVSADMRLRAMDGNYDSSKPAPVMEVHKVKGVWESQTISWANKPDYDPTVEDYAVTSAKNSYYNWDVTDLVRGWYEGENTGMMFKMSDSVEAAANVYSQFYSSDFSYYQVNEKPTLTIIFRNNNGLESYWDYTTASAGRAGTGYISNYTGNLVWTRGDIGFSGNLMPVSISHIYNANDSANNTFGLGNGWRTNFNQRVYHWDSANAYGDYYVWEDSDGTVHYFPHNSNDSAYKDEDGLDLTLTVSGTGTEKYTIQDKYGNKSYFDTRGRLTKQENNQQTPSSITIAYNSTTGYQISKITDGAGRVYNFTYTGDLLTRIGYMGSGEKELSFVTFGYTGGNLTSIADQDGKTSAYTYADNTADTSKNLLATAVDPDGYKLTYTYSTFAAGKPARVVGVQESDGTALGGALTIEYAKNQTTFTDHNQNVQIMQFNNLGNTVSIQDDQGRAQYAQYAINNDEETSGPANQLRLSSKLQNTVGNVLSDSSFEGSSLWTATSGAVTRSIASGTAYLGNNSLKLVRSSDGDAAGVYSAAFSVAAGETYTFSAWVKTGTGAAWLALNDGSTTVTSEVLGKNKDWTRLEVSYTASAAKTLTARLLTEEAGTVYMDCAQVEKAVTASRYNLIENGDFRDTSAWSDSSGRTTLANVAASELSSDVYSMTGNPTGINRISQRVNVSGSKGDTFVLAGWAKGDSAPLTPHGNNTPAFSLIATFVNPDGTLQTSQSIHFNPDTDSSVSWQYAADAIVAAADYSSVVIEISYDYNVNTVYFDGIQLYKEEFGASYTYDDEGNVKSVKDIQGQTTTYEYEDNDLTRAILPTGAELTYTYDDYHNVLTATSETGVTYHFEYDDWGNNTKVSIVSGTATISSSAAYSTDGNRLVSTTDAAGKVTTYGYNADTNLLEWVRYPEDTEATRTEYTYDTMYRLASAEATTDAGSALTAEYTYTGDLLTAIETASTTYTFSYGDFSLSSQIKVGARTLASYSYTNDRNFYLQKLEYGNRDSVEYTYDDQGRVTAQTYEDGDTVTYKYDNSGALATVTDSATGRKTTYYYDFTDRLMKYVESGEGYNHSVGYEYDTINNLTALVETINGVEHRTSYTYDLDNRVTSVTNGDTTKTYTYDAYSRVDELVTKNGDTTVLTTGYTYRNPTATSTTGQISQLVLDAAGFDVTYSYTYDDNGNILSVSDGTNTTSYVYDTAGQLLRENNQAANKTWVWTYDNAGNIQSRKEYAYSADTLGEVVDTVTYGYTDDSWGDLLTAYDGIEIEYDTIGNPLDDGTWEYTWEHGRQLASMTDGTTTWSYSYNSDGLRTKRTDGTTTYEYVYNGGSLVQMTVGNDTLYFGNGTVTYNGVVYYYATNLQGDITAILNTGGTAVVQYTYDAWGNILTTTGTLASTLGAANPLRYRGYVYDAETGLYYLQSRYYDPEIGRFLGADVVYDYDAGLQGYDLFLYCGNNPVNRIDISGADSLDFVDGNKEDEPLLEGGAPGNGNPSGGGAYSPITSGRFRQGLKNLTGGDGVNQDAHHIFPKSFTEPFAKLGINNQDPIYGSWWDSTSHRQAANEYNKWWHAFFSIDGVTADDAFALVEFLSALFGFELNY